MSLFDASVTRAADALDQKYGNFDNFAAQNGISSANQASMDALRAVSPNAAQTLDNCFGAARVMMDSNGNGAIEFGEIADTLKSLTGIGGGGSGGGGGALDSLFSTAKDVLTAPLKMQMKAWEGWDDDKKNGSSSPSDDGMGCFLSPLENTLGMVKKMMP